MPNRVITISREYGSGGSIIAKMAAEKLAIPCYDAELIERIAEESGYHIDYVREKGEYATGGFISAAFADRTMGLTHQDKLWNIQKRIIVELAQKSPCVIVGRCADYILQEVADCLNVFIYASIEARVERIQRDYKKKHPEQLLREIDKRRAAYHRFYTNLKWGHAQNYHICLDSGAIGIERCAGIICGLYEKD